MTTPTSDSPRAPTTGPSPLPRAGALGIVALSSAAVLVLEIVAGRLMAPYVGISLETFTGIIGTVLAGIAAGAWGGGRLADTAGPERLIGPAIGLGGVLAWLSLPILRALGPQLGDGPVAIVALTACAFLAPCAVLSAVTPMVAKLRLRDLGETGSVIGGLSAAGTLGAIAGTFLTGFVLVSAAPTKPIVIGLGGFLVVLGGAVSWRLQRALPTLSTLALVVVAAGGGVASTSPCQHETAYFCVRIEVDERDPTLRSLYLDRLRHAAIDLDDPTVLDIRYIRVFAAVADALPPGPIDTLHIGGGGFSFPRYLQHIRPGSTDLVLEIDPALVSINQRELGLELTDTLRVRTGDARLALGDLPTDGYDLVVGDAFASASVPWHLTTEEFLTEIARVLRPGGIYVMNVIDGGGSDFARAELATLSEVFDTIGVVLPAGGVPPDRAVNQVLLASDAPLPASDLARADGRLLRADETRVFVGEPRTLTDDFAPVDQLARH